MKTGSDDWKTPLGVYERSIAELRRTREEIQAEMQNLRQMQVSLGELSNLKTELENSQVKIESLKADLEKTKGALLITQKIASDAQHRVADAEREANSAHKELENLKQLMNNNQNSNPQLIEIVSKLQDQLAKLPLINTASSQEDDFKSQIIQSISDLRAQVSKLSDELMLVSPVTGKDYTQLRNLLAHREWRKADEETLKFMVKISNRNRDGWRWLDRGEIEQFPWQDLRIINRLWVEYSNGRFGFSVQKQIWQNINVANNNNFEVENTLGDRVGWRVNNNWIKYDELTFDIIASEGHLPSTVHILGVDKGRVEDRVRLLLSRRELQI
ncbi:GUN4 domain-containing protein [Argonema antarcticum]|uniref:GUN4 domain-containing protein n=1 Tax=Argonema antarcticum TaxID=2942763 RepID=UPI0020134357|nr:GUN4 domain-containing protein [Argonema antarcticum]MCL1475477.1 GUN4 domain-containing protein [Argonema antarcticum A004/B2]